MNLLDTEFLRVSVHTCDDSWHWAGMSPTAII